MSAIELYIIDDKGFFSHKRVGDIDSIVTALESEGEFYTLTPPPDYNHSWRWQDDKWITDETA
ncbi:hypothetical protein [Psychrobacter pygoscelis]|uniref:hypothetical protein n=1 Tax=Psychrobacter pygoscelis TaxID=2488563 RepID=UPI00103EBF33|nr:hypothetical protein [Psychrobacter pygoscelis]